MGHHESSELRERTESTRHVSLGNERRQNAVLGYARQRLHLGPSGGLRGGAAAEKNLMSEYGSIHRALSHVVASYSKSTRAYPIISVRVNNRRPIAQTPHEVLRRTI